MFKIFLHSVAVGAMSAGALLAGAIGTSAVASAEIQNPFDGSDLTITTAPQPPILDPGPYRPKPNEILVEQHQMGDLLPGLIPNPEDPDGVDPNDPIPDGPWSDVLVVVEHTGPDPQPWEPDPEPWEPGQRIPEVQIVR